MSDSTLKKSGGIPQRNDIDDVFTWNLKDLFESSEVWEKDYQKAEKLIDQVAAFSGRLAESAQTLFECLELRNRLSIAVFNLTQYAHLNKDLDGRVSEYQAMTDRAAMLASKASAVSSFIEPELLKLSDNELTKMAGQFEKTDLYDFYISELIRSRKHIRSEEVEELLAQSAMVARGAGTTFSGLDNADLKYPSIIDEAGNEVQLTKQRFAKFMESSDGRVRREASEKFYSVYQAHLNTIGSTLTSGVNTDIFYSRARRYDSCLHSALDSDNIPVEVYHALLDTTEAHLEGLHKWTALRKKILKLDEIKPYDMMCPLFPEKDREVPWAEAVSEVYEAVKPLGEKYRTDLKQAFDSRWVDVYETEGKTGGAYSWGNYSAHPFVLMNYNNTVDNMFTLAHEMGHAMHSNLSNRHQPYQKSQYSIFVAEVASTLNEGLLLRLLLGKAKDAGDKLYLLNRQIDNTMGTFFNQVMYARFELLIHEQVEKGQALSPDMLSELWEGLTQKYYGKALTMDAMTKYKWSRIPHFYTSFYVYQYATSYAASQAILEKFLSGEEGIIDKYLTLISSGGNDYPIEQLKKCGVDMMTSDPVKATLRLFGEQVDEVERLA